MTYSWSHPTWSLGSRMLWTQANQKLWGWSYYHEIRKLNSFAWCNCTLTCNGWPRLKLDCDTDVHDALLHSIIVKAFMQLWWPSETSSVISSYLDIHLVAMHLGRWGLYICTPLSTLPRTLSDPRLPRDYVRQPIGPCHLFTVPCFIGSATSSATNKVSTWDSINVSIIVVTKWCKTKHSYFTWMENKKLKHPSNYG